MYFQVFGFLLIILIHRYVYIILLHRSFDYIVQNKHNIILSNVQTIDIIIIIPIQCTDLLLKMH